MKTKTKILAMAEIAIVLCSVFLVATLPAIAAEQTTQKVSANTITTASEDDYVLDIYGNANDDDTIDMGDVVYIKLVIFGKKDKTELCDAKYDDRINVLDIIQTKLIILGKEKRLTVIDFVGRIVTVKKPIKRVVSLVPYDLDVIRILRLQDKIVGVFTKDEIYFPELAKLPYVGYNDYEAILNLHPDLVTARWGVEEAAKKLPGITVIGSPIGPYEYITPLREGVMTFGYIFDKEDDAKHYLDDHIDKHLDLIKARTEGLSEEERPIVYEEMYAGPYRVAPWLVEATGGRDIFADIPTGLQGATVDPEAVIERNPDIIIKKVYEGTGYGVDDISKAKAARDEMMSRPELANVSAVKNGRVYAISGKLTYGSHHPIAIAYYAKWFYPDLFEDFDPQAIHQEHLEIQGLDFDVSKHGVFVYHPELYPDGR